MKIIDRKGRLVTRDGKATILKQFGSWYVTDQGLWGFEGDHRDWASYHVHRERLDEDDWVSHMEEKCWCDMRDFCAALRFAKKVLVPREGSGWLNWVEARRSF